MIKFGPSGNDERFYAEGYKSTYQAPAWLKQKGLDLFEYPFGRGVNMSEPTAKVIADEAKKNGIEISVHAPYFINFATTEDDKAQNSFRYILESAAAARMLGGNRIVFHPGSPMKQPREAAQERILSRLKELIIILDENGYNDMIICPETMGKINQMGTLDEVIEMCRINEKYIPCIDFGHINARECGSLKTYDDYKRIIDRLNDGIGKERTEQIHVHFSHIQYGKMGEIKHLTFADTEYGPFFEPLAAVFNDHNISAHVLCESAGTQSDDALTMKRIFEEISAK